MSMTYIVSSLPGRIRLRDVTLCESQRLEQLRATLAAIEGVLALEANRKAGSLVVRYDATALERHDIEMRIDAAARHAIAPQSPDSQKPATENVVSPTPPPRTPSSRVRVNRYAKRSMLISLSVSLLLAGAGRKRWHAIFGVLFLTSLSTHLWVHRRYILR